MTRNAASHLNAYRQSAETFQSHAIAVHMRTRYASGAKGRRRWLAEALDSFLCAWVG